MKEKKGKIFCSLSPPDFSFLLGRSGLRNSPSCCRIFFPLGRSFCRTSWKQKVQLGRKIRGFVFFVLLFLWAAAAAMGVLSPFLPPFLPLVSLPVIGAAGLDRTQLRGKKFAKLSGVKSLFPLCFCHIALKSIQQNY